MLGRWLCCLVVLVGCGKKAATSDGVRLAYVLRGQLSLGDDSDAVASDIEGTFDLSLYRTADEGYCLLGPEGLAAAANRITFGITGSRLRATPLRYEIRVVEEPEQKYPILVHPVALLRVGDDPLTPCVDDFVKQRSAIGVTGSEVASPCCGLLPNSVKIDFAGQTLENVDFVMHARSGSCSGLGQAFNRCELGDACSAALGERASTLLKNPEGTACVAATAP